MNKNKNSVELLGYYGSDEIIACSAWTSTSRELSEEKRARIPALIKKLASDGHHTPFEKGQLHFLVNCDIASHIHLLKHRISSLNAESARYKELKEDKYYLPEDWGDIKDSDGVWNNATNDYIGETETWAYILQRYTEIGNELYHACLRDIEPLVGRKRAKESARYFKTYNSQIQADVMFNWRSFVNFQNLRNSKSAQKEIQDIAQQMLQLVRDIPENPFQHTIDAFFSKDV